MTNGEWIRGCNFDEILYHLKKKCPPYVQSCKASDCDDCWQKWEQEEHVPFEKLSLEQQWAWELKDFFLQAEELVQKSYLEHNAKWLREQIEIRCKIMEVELSNFLKIKFKAEKGEKIDE